MNRPTLRCRAVALGLSIAAFTTALPAAAQQQVADDARQRAAWLQVFSARLHAAVSALRKSQSDIAARQAAQAASAASRASAASAAAAALAASATERTVTALAALDRVRIAYVATRHPKVQIEWRLEGPMFNVSDGWLSTAQDTVVASIFSRGGSRQSLCLGDFLAEVKKDVRRKGKHDPDSDPAPQAVISFDDFIRHSGDRNCSDRLDWSISDHATEVDASMEAGLLWSLSEKMQPDALPASTTAPALPTERLFDLMGVGVKQACALRHLDAALSPHTPTAMSPPIAMAVETVPPCPR